eukprot:2378218-Lingulodinium_polyedra.AAC.1
MIAPSQVQRGGVATRCFTVLGAGPDVQTTAAAAQCPDCGKQADHGVSSCAPSSRTPSCLIGARPL